jgi:hypothetical protein
LDIRYLVLKKQTNGINKMTIKTAIIAGSFYFLSNIAIAEQTPEPQPHIDIPILSDAQVFSKFDDKYPAMVTYFTKKSFDEITAYYNQEFGAVVSEQTRYGRLELIYSHMDHDIRVIVDGQKDHREVDVMIEAKAAATAEPAEQ